MQLQPHVEALLADLAEIAAVGGEETEAAAGRLVAPLRSAAGRRFLDALGEVTLELSAQLPTGHVEVRLAGQEPSLVYVDEEAGAGPAPAEDGLTARITLRLPEGLKAGIEASAAREGLSVNAWIIRALARSTGSTARRGPGSRLTGFARG
ncbi:MAG: YlcI/YnfO family protein [Gaiellaceae bacterium]